MPPRARPQTRPLSPWEQERAERALAASLARRNRVIAIVFGIIVLLVVGAVINPPTASVHGFSKASDYKASRETGCTNSGKGCHGSEDGYRDFNAYHKNASCTACHDYQGIGCIPCHHGNQNECQLCHDGTVRNAPDVIGLTDNWPHGHYRETTHTAMGTEFETEVRAAPGGKAKSKCSACHSQDLRRAHTEVKPVKGSPYGESVGCGECHNDERASGLAQVKSKWKSRRCEDCHVTSSSTPMHAADVAPNVAADTSSTCGSSGPGCHASADLHALHPDRPASCTGSAVKGEPACHTANAEAKVPTAKSCGEGARGACHATYPAGKLGHENDAEVHAPATGEASRDTSYKGIACGRCHAMQANGHSLLDEHELWTSAKKNVAGDVCRDCHNDPASQKTVAEGWTASDGQYACYSCHGQSGLARDHRADLSAVHVSDSPGCASTGAGCHPTDDLSQVGTPSTTANIHRDCLRCHDRQAAGGNQAYDPRKKTCGADRDCHGDGDEYDPKTSVHDGARGRVDGADRLHAAGKAQSGQTLHDAESGLDIECSACHASALGTEHSRTSSVLSSRTVGVCVGCHDANAVTSAVVKSGWSARGGKAACAACHEGTGGPRPHERIASAHAGTELSPKGAATPGACVAGGCHATADLRTVHKQFGCTVSGCHQAKGDIDGSRIRSCGGSDPKTSCHAGYSATAGHKDLDELHRAMEVDATGTPTPGFCARSGCHTSADLRKLHSKVGCTIAGCHAPGSSAKQQTCGGEARNGSCHPGFSAEQHFVDHRADISGIVKGISYGPGTNVGCFGCHDADLRVEHTGVEGAGITGGGTSNCRVCHYDPEDPGSGAYADLSSVKRAITSHDLRCTSCHASGSAAPDGDAAASPHKRSTGDDPLPAGREWDDPLSEWRAAFESPTGGGHNVLPSTVVGGGVLQKLFPVTTYTKNGVTYSWPLPANSGDTTWLRSDVFGGAGSTDAIRHITIECSDCHLIPDGMKGPHGSAVKVYIDPDYSQTEYANPTRGLKSQFETSGTQRVVCFKCHNLAAGSVPGSDKPGGSYVHAQHAEHPGFPSYNPVRYGDKCVDCHVRIPHAWRHPRLLARTVETTDGVPPDTYPYVSADYDGLLGVRLGDIEGTSAPKPASCVTGGCHGRHGVKSHPMPSDVPTSAYWP